MLTININKYKYKELYIVVKTIESLNDSLIIIKDSDLKRFSSYVLKIWI